MKYVKRGLATFPVMVVFLLYNYYILYWGRQPESDTKEYKVYKFIVRFKTRLLVLIGAIMFAIIALQA